MVRPKPRTRKSTRTREGVKFQDRAPPGIRSAREYMNLQSSLPKGKPKGRAKPPHMMTPVERRIEQCRQALIAQTEANINEARMMREETEKRMQLFEDTITETIADALADLPRLVKTTSRKRRR